MRTFHVINSLGAGGAERSLVEIALGFPERGIEPEIVVLNSVPEGFEAEARERGLPVHIIGGTNAAANGLGLVRLIRQRRPQVIHTTIFESDVLGRVAGAVTRVPVVTSLVNASYSEHRLADPKVNPRKLEAARKIESGTARTLGAGFHAITGAVADAAVDDLRIRPDRIEVIPRGRSSERLGRRTPERRAAVRERLGIDESTFVVLNVGRREFQKGQDSLIQAAALRELDGAVVLVAGRDGNEAAALDAEVARLGLGDTIRFLGHVDEVPDLFAAADVFVFPSRFEGLGGSLIEALALETPVVATDIPALREVLDDGRLGLLVPVDAPAELAAAIGEIRDRPHVARERAAAGRAEFETRFTIEAVQDSMAAWLKSFT